MKQSTKYLALAAAFIVGIGSVIGFQVHAQSVPAVTAPTVAPTATAAPVQTSQQDPKNTDGETADDTATMTKGTAKSSVAADTAETENGASDANEVEDGN